MTRKEKPEELSLEDAKQEIKHLKKSVKRQKVRLATFSLFSLVLGSTGFFGVFTYFIDRPIQIEKDKTEIQYKEALTKIENLKEDLHVITVAKKKQETELTKIQTYNESLKEELHFAELDKRKRDFLVANYEKRIAALEQQMSLQVDPQKKEQLSQQLLELLNNMDRELATMSNTLREMENRGDNWFRSRARNSLQQAFRIQDQIRISKDQLLATKN